MDRRVWARGEGGRGGHIRLFQVKGIPVRLHWSWGFGFMLVLVSLAASLFPGTYPGLSWATYVAMAMAATALFFLSILVHELSHALWALREGMRVRDITLWLFGGMSSSEEPLRTPGAEFRVVAAGPLASAALAGAFLGLAGLAGAMGLPEPVRGVADYLARINGLLLAFNVVPALPLDGGRLLHAALWRRSGDRAWATIQAAKVGQGFAFVLIWLGIVSLLGGGVVGGMWFAFLGWFLLQAVQQEASSARVEQAMSGLRVRDLMASDLVTVSPDASIREVARSTVRSSPHRSYPVIDHGHLVGLFSLRAAARLEPSRRGVVSVGDVMLTDEVPVVHPDEPVIDAIDDLRREPGRAFVLDDDNRTLVGLLSTTDLARAIEMAARRDAPAQPARGRGVVALWLLGCVALLALAATLYHPPFLVMEPGAVFDITDDITISGVPVDHPTGTYVLTSVRLSQPNALLVLVAAFRDDREVVAIEGVGSSGVPLDDVGDAQRLLFLESQQMAAVAAAQAAGYEATVSGGGAEVVALASGSSAASSLEVGDVIIQVDDEVVRTSSELQDAVSGRPRGQVFRLRVHRAGEAMEVSVDSGGLSSPAGGTGIGVVAVTRDLQVGLPFQIDFRDRPQVGGPSAGLIYAIAITDMLDTHDVAEDRVVAATGTVGPDGLVGAVGGLQEKVIAALDAGADVMIVPWDEMSSVDALGLPIRGVVDLRQAVDALLDH